MTKTIKRLCLQITDEEKKQLVEISQADERTLTKEIKWLIQRRYNKLKKPE